LYLKRAEVARTTKSVVRQRIPHPVFACDMRMKLGVALTNVGNATWKGSTFLIGHPRIRPKTEPWSITIEWPITEWNRRLNIRATKHVNGC
jgi:hypothetical protein